MQVKVAQGHAVVVSPEEKAVAKVRIAEHKPAHGHVAVRRWSDVNAAGLFLNKRDERLVLYPQASESKAAQDVFKSENIQKADDLWIGIGGHRQGPRQLWML